MFHFHPFLGKWSILTNIFQMGWNHQLDLGCNPLILTIDPNFLGPQDIPLQPQHIPL